MSENTRSRAARVLNVPADTDSRVAASAFLAALANSQFVPSSQSVAALNALVNLGLPVDAGTVPSLREEVEEFAGRYWSLTPAERLATWLALSTRSPDDSTARRLLTLQAGLELPATPFPDAASERLAAIVRELYVLRPRERAIRRNEWLLANSGRHRELVFVGMVFRRDHSAFAALALDLFERLSPHFNAALFAEAATAAPLPERTYGPKRPIARTAAKARPRATPKYKPIKPRDYANLGILLIVGVLLLTAGLCVSTFLSGAEKPTKRYPDIPLKQPQYHQQPQQNFKVTFTASEVQSFIQYEEQEQKRKKENTGFSTSPPAPRYYLDWVIAGKPAATESK